MEEQVVEFHLNYNKNRNNPAELFHAMAEFIETYQDLGQVLSDAIESETRFAFELQEVTKGSILAKLALKVEKWTRPDPLLKSFTGEISLPCDVKSRTNAEIERLKTEINSQKISRIEPYISDLDIALAMDKWSEANKKLLPDEHLTICNEGENLSNVIPFDQSFRFTGDPKKMFSRDKGHHDGEEVVEIFKPCNKGNSQWEFVSIKTKRTYKAEILHKKWLEDYQNSKTRLGGQDYLRVHSKYDVITENGKDVIRNAKILEVIEVINCGGIQHEIPE